MILVFLVTIFITIASVSAVSDDNTTTASEVSVESPAIDYNQVNDVNNDNKVNYYSKSNTKNNAKSSSSIVTSENKKSEIKSNNDKISNESESSVLTTDTQTNNEISTNQTTSNSTTKSLKTASVKTNVILNVNSMNATPYQNVTFRATGYTSDGVPLDNVKTVFKVNGITLNNTYFYNGVALLNYTIPNWSSSNVYDISVKVGESSTLLATTATSKLTILKSNISVSMDSYTAQYNSTITLKVVAKYKNGTAVSYAPVAFKINGITVGNAVLSNGVATLNYTTSTKCKSYEVLAIVGETSKINMNSTTSTLIVTSPSTITVQNNAFSKKSTATITVKVTDNNGVSASGKVAIKINGITIKSESLTNGQLSVNYDMSSLSKSINTIYVVYGGSTYVKSSNITVPLILYNNKYTYSQILQKAYDTKVFIEKYNKLPNYVTVGTDQVSPADFFYMLCKVYDSNSSFVSADLSIQTTSKTSNYNVKIYKEDYINLAKDIVDCYELNGRSPYSIKTSSYNMSFADAFYFYTRAVAYIYSNGICSNYGTVLAVNSSSGSASTTTNSNSSTTTNVVPDGYSKYLAKTDNCQVNDTYIKNTVAKAISGVSGTYNQAVAIFNYVNDNTDYSGYYNTRYGAINTLSRGYGNCVDMAHALIAMWRTANIPARYCHSVCTFRSGLVTGHVWAEVYVNGKWYSCDATSSSNTFGNIVNWSKCTSIKRYIELPF